jgi:hypothetical protein
MDREIEVLGDYVDAEVEIGLDLGISPQELHQPKCRDELAKISPMGSFWTLCGHGFSRDP